MCVYVFGNILVCTLRGGVMRDISGEIWAQLRWHLSGVWK